MQHTSNAKDDEVSISLVERVYVQLRRDIIEGKYPPGSKLRIEQLKKEYGIGGGTCREALTLLQSDWLVTLFGHGFRVTDVSYEDFVDITNTRLLLEVEALRQSIMVGDEQWEADVVAAFHRLSRADEALSSSNSEAVSNWEQRHKSFHASLISACPSRWTKQFASILYNQAERYRRLMLAYIDTEGSPVQQQWPRQIKEHTGIFEAVLERDVAKGLERLTAHISEPIQDAKALPIFAQSRPKPKTIRRNGRSKP